MLNQDPLQFYLAKHDHTKKVMKPITERHEQNSIQFPNVESRSPSILHNEAYHHTKIMMRPIAKIHMGTKTQCHFHTIESYASIQFYQLKNCHTKDCDENHHTNTHTKPNFTLQMLNDK
jgi:hypothetical protein